MSRRTLNTWLFVLAIGLGSYAAWQWQRNRQPPPAPAQRSDYVLRDFELTALGDDGLEAFTVTAPYLERDPAGESLTLEQPRFGFPGSDGRWNARADRAWVSPGAEEVRLLGGVNLVGPPEASGLRTRFASPSLSVFPDAQRASTDERVTITQGESRFAGTGLRVDMAAKRFQLLNDVKGHYAPRQ
jgi:lipopolysaccharide export system protein LptC